MILTCHKRIKNSFALFATLLLFFSCTPFFAHAQVNPDNALSLSVTPTLFEMSAAPSQKWDSSIKVINNNKHPLTVFASVVNFAPEGESGQGKFLPVFEEATGGTTLAEWIDITQDPVVIAPEQSASIPLSVNVPLEAAPGGHFAAILVGTRPMDNGESFQVKTSQLVTSLFFVRVAGDVEEVGSVREFRTVEKFVDTPEADFEVRFENKGNVHLQPQGEIVITNMWGKERGVIPINHQTHFGNVLPESIRKFEFTWKGEQSFSDIGRYKAQLSLAYGEESRKFVTSSTYFYVIPIKALAIVLGSLAAFIFLLTWMIKVYVRRMLALAGVEPAYSSRNRSTPKAFVREGDVKIERRVSMKAPVQSGLLDLKSRLANVHQFTQKIKAFIGFVVAYKLFFTSSVLVLIALVVGVLFLREVMTEQRDYEVVIENPDTSVTLSSEEIMYERGTDESDEVVQETRIEPTEEQVFELVLTNSSDTPGRAAELQAELEAQGYEIADLQSDFNESKDRTVIVYDTQVQEEALTLSKLLNNALLSAAPTDTEGAPTITVYIGNDYRE